MIVIDREWLADGEPSPELIWEVLKQFDGERFRLNELKDYYDGEHSISERWRGRGAPNYRLSHDLPGYIVAMTSGYLTGEPIQYTVNGEWTGFQTLLDCLRRSAAGSVDSELAADAALYGKGVEMYYADENAMPRLCRVRQHRGAQAGLRRDADGTAEPAFSADGPANRSDDGGMERPL